MNPEALDIYLVRGGTFGLEVEYQDTQGALVPFVGWSGESEVRDVDLNLFLTLAVVLTNPGIITLSATDEATEAMPPGGRAGWDLFLNDPAGNRWPVLAGLAFIRDARTQR